MAFSISLLTPPPSRYAFDALGEQEQWTLAGMAARLPRGLGGMYQHVMKTLCEALQAERPDMLRLLRERLLPVLVAARDSLTVEQLGIAVGVGVDTSSADVRGGAGCVGRVAAGWARAIQQGAECVGVEVIQNVCEWGVHVTRCVGCVVRGVGGTCNEV